MRRLALTLIGLALLGPPALAGQGNNNYPAKAQPAPSTTAAGPSASQHSDAAGKGNSNDASAGKSSPQKGGGDKGAAEKADQGGSDKRGQAVSDCNHEANERKLTGQNRHDFVEWCTSRGYRYEPSRSTRYWDDDRSCYSRANERGLTGDKRAEFLRSCLGSEGGRVARDGKCIQGGPRGGEVRDQDCED